MALPARRSFSRREFFGLPNAAARAHAQVGEACLAFQRIACESCAEACDSEAIRFSRIDAVVQPTIDAERCTACEACIPVCPASALCIVRPAGESR